MTVIEDFAIKAILRIGGYLEWRLHLQGLATWWTEATCPVYEWLVHRQWSRCAGPSA
jgi:hypothetical protein